MFDSSASYQLLKELNNLEEYSTSVGGCYRLIETTWKQLVSNIFSTDTGWD